MIKFDILALCSDMLSLRNKALLVKLFLKNADAASLSLHSYCTMRRVKMKKKKLDDSYSSASYEKKIRRNADLEDR